MEERGKIEVLRKPIYDPENEHAYEYRGEMYYERRNADPKQVALRFGLFAFIGSGNISPALEYAHERGRGADEQRGKQRERNEGRNELMPCIPSAVLQIIDRERSRCGERGGGP